MPRPLAAAALLLAAACLHAQTVELRMIERQGQQYISTVPLSDPLTDNILNIALQARVVGGGPSLGLTGFQLTIHAPCELDSYGPLSRLLTSNADGTYAPNVSQAGSNTVGLGGLAAQFSSLAAGNPDFNGLINTSSGPFTNGPDQEIGLIQGLCAGGPLLAQSDLDHDGNPDTWPGTGTIAPIDPAYASQYLGASGNWVDVYRFKYRTTAVWPRWFGFVLENATAQVASSFGLSNGLWQPLQSPVAVVPGTVIAFPIGFGGVTVSGSCCLPSGECRTVMSCTECILGTYTPDVFSCSPNPCPQSGACCISAACSIVTSVACESSGGQFHGVGSACGLPANLTTCCPANFNAVGGLSTQDIFDFLAAWFTLDARADFDHNQTLEVADIFAFLQAWFAGCG